MTFCLVKLKSNCVKEYLPVNDFTNNKLTVSGFDECLWK